MAEPVREPPVSAVAGMVAVPVRVPPERVMVNGKLMLAPLTLVSEKVALMVPVPMPLRLAGPVTVMVVPIEPVALVTVNVVLVVAACAPAAMVSASHRLRDDLVIGLSESSTIQTQIVIKIVMK